MTRKEISQKVADLSNECFFLAKDDFFQGEVSPLVMVLKSYLENASFTLDKFSDGIVEESGEEDS